MHIESDDSARPLTDRQQQIFEFMRSFKFIKPSMREIAKHFQISPTTAQGHVEALRKKGRLPA